MLSENHVLTLPDHETLKDADGNKAYPHVVDGIVYNFELISGTRHRSYSYGCPKAAANDFPYLKELAWAAAIIEETVRYCKIRKSLKC